MTFGAAFRRARTTWADARGFALLGVAILVLHLVEVHLVDPPATRAVREAVGRATEAGVLWETPVAVALDASVQGLPLALLVVWYFAAFLGLLALVPWIVAATGNGRLLRRTVLAYAAIYAMVLPFYLLLPVDNPYTRLALSVPFDAVHPRLEDVYYLLTTRDNTFPSLHVAFTTVLAARGLAAVRRPAGRAALLAVALSLAATVVLVRAHYVVDVAAGLAVGLVALRLADLAVAGRGPLAPLARAVEKVGSPRAPEPGVARAAEE